MKKTKENNMSMNKVYLVIQHQALNEYDKNVAYVCASREVAEYAAGQLNKEYASSGVKLDKDNLFVEVSDDDIMSDVYHYYTVESHAIENSIEELKRDHNL
jgi:hypothetical protein